MHTNSRAGGDPFPDISVYQELNGLMNALTVPFLVNRSMIEDFWEVLERAHEARNQEYWLLAARLTELALLCAGQYADCGEFRCARDLLYSTTGMGLFPSLYARLQASERISNAYMLSLEARWAAVVRALRGLSARRIDGAEAFWTRYANTTFDEQFDIENNACFFGPALFQEMGHDVTRMAHAPEHRSRFLR